ncbi:MAG: hypothetical protein II336_07485 [Loktanella sp.]|nr:hypothetical protein [Loktanella sp.]
MLRIILLVMFVSVIAVGFLAVMGTLRAITGPAAEKDEEPMPAPFRRISYTVLIVLMFGVTTGWLGAS